MLRFSAGGRLGTGNAQGGYHLAEPDQLTKAVPGSQIAQLFGHLRSSHEFERGDDELLVCDLTHLSLRGRPSSG
jgi:hypothetical protein